MTLLLGLQALAYWPVWSWYLRRMGDGADDPCGIVALLTAVAFCLVGRRNRPAGPWPRGPLVCLLVYALLFAWLPPILRAAVAVLGLALTFSRACFGRRLAPGVTGLMLLSLPVLASAQFYIGYPLRVLTARLAVRMLAAVGTHASVLGTQILWRGELIGVDPPCSGVRMLWTACYVAATVTALNGLGALGAVVLAAVAVAAVLVANAMRAALLFFGESGLAALPGWTHAAAGLAVFAVTAAMIVTTAEYLRRRHDANRLPARQPGRRNRPGAASQRTDAVRRRAAIPGLAESL